VIKLNRLDFPGFEGVPHFLRIIGAEDKTAFFGRENLDQPNIIRMVEDSTWGGYQRQLTCESATDEGGGWIRLIRQIQLRL